MASTTRKEIHDKNWEFYKYLHRLAYKTDRPSSTSTVVFTLWNELNTRRTKGLNAGPQKVVRKPFANFHAKLIEFATNHIGTPTKLTDDNRRLFRDVLPVLMNFVFEGSQLVDRHEIRNLFRTSVTRITKGPQEPTKEEKEETFNKLEEVEKKDWLFSEEEIEELKAKAAKLRQAKRYKGRPRKSGLDVDNLAITKIKK